jgi:lipopolysaccharide transport system permease protein
VAGPIPRAHYVQLVLYKTYAELKSEAARTYMSFLWWVIEPVLLMMVFYLVFGLLLNRFTEDFIPFLLVGLVVWRWFESSISQGGASIISSRGLMNQVYVPKLVFPAVVILVNAFKFSVVLVLLIGFLQWYGKPVSVYYWALPLLLATQLSLNIACALLLAATIPFLPDLRIVVSNVMRVLFFLSGIFFSTHRVPDAYREYLSFNPMFTLIESYRAALLEGSWPRFMPLATIGLLSCVGLVAGIVLIRRYDRIYPRAVL